MPSRHDYRCVCQWQSVVFNCHFQRLGPGDARATTCNRICLCNLLAPPPTPPPRLPFHPPPTPPRPHDRPTGLTSWPDKPVALAKSPPSAIVSSFPLQLTRDSASASLSDKLLQSRLLKSRNWTMAHYVWIPYVDACVVGWVCVFITISAGCRL